MTNSQKEFDFKKYFVRGEQNEELGVVLLEHLWAKVFALKIKINKPEALKQLDQVVAEAFQDAREQKAENILFRLTRGENSSEEVSQHLVSWGFVKKNERIEFKRPVAELPGDEGTPLTWKTAKELGWSDQEIANNVQAVMAGDPDADPVQDPLTYIQDFLQDTELTSGPECIHIGFIGNEKAAVSVVQIKLETGWSRISYMGVFPRFRKQNLGIWAHRHSFQVMKNLGGKLYHGGTVSENYPMLKLFEKHGCERFREMSEWNLTLQVKL
jgi:hypothetical protein